MRRFLNNFSWVALFILTPIAFLILLSQNAVPGDLLYPLKRAIEKSILVAAELHPTTRAAFHTDLTERRFYEAQTLLLAKQDTVALTEFTYSISEAEKQIKLVRDEKAQEELERKLITSITNYQNKLEETKQKVEPPPMPTSPQIIYQTPNLPPPTIVTTTNIQVIIAIDDTNKKLEEVKEKIKEKQKERHEKQEKEKKDEEDREDRNGNEDNEDNRHDRGDKGGDRKRD